MSFPAVHPPARSFHTVQSRPKVVDIRMIFKAFSKTIGNLPVQAVLKTLELTCNMLQDDFEYARLAGADDALSVLSFGHFVLIARKGETYYCSRRLPPDHLEFYRETIVRLVQFGDLPISSMEEFDRAFPFP